MKNIITLMAITMLLSGCADQKQETTQEVIASENVEAIQKKT
jgi:PBP1b-binding outer membrane lipoprotein LpoB